MSAFATEVGATATRAAIASPTVQTAVQTEAKKQLWAKIGFSSTPTQEPVHQPSMSMEGVDQSIIQGKSEKYSSVMLSFLTYFLLMCSYVRN